MGGQWRMEKHPWKIIAWIACTLGGFASFLQWLGLKPKDLAMTSSIPIPHVLWLLLAIALFAVGIGSSLWAGVVQRRHLSAAEKRLSTLEKIPHTILTINGDRLDGTPAAPVETVTKDEVRRIEIAHNAELSRAREAQRQCDEERREALRKAEEIEAQLSIFSPLQIQAFRLARDMGNYLTSLGPKPTISEMDFPDTADGRFRLIHARFDAEEPWLVRLRSKCDEDFLPRLQSIINQFGMIGKADTLLNPHRAHIAIEEEFEEVRSRLVALAHSVDGIFLEPKT
jgi:hypothetical protein